MDFDSNTYMLKGMVENRFSHYLILLSCAILIFSQVSCVIVSNLNYQTARNLKKGQTEFGGHFTDNFQPDPLQPEQILHAPSFGFRAGTGVSDNFNFFLRYENTLIDTSLRQSMIELDFKFMFKSHESDSTVRIGSYVKGGIGLPIQLFFYDGYTALAFNPRLLFTFFADRPHFEFTISPKLWFLNGQPNDEPFWDSSDSFIMNGGISVNALFSSNKDKWAIIPAVGLLNRGTNDDNVLNAGLHFKFMF